MDPQTMQQADPEVARIAAAHLGVPQEPPPEPRASDDPTTDERVQEAASPETEGDLQDAIAYEIEIAGSKRKMTPTQIAGIVERYTGLNHKHAELKPIIRLAEELISKVNVPPDRLASVIAAALKAYRPNPQMGGDSASSPSPDAAAGETPRTAEDADQLFRRWEEENASTLPPGYREMTRNMHGITRAMQEMQVMMQQLLAQNQSVRQQADASSQEAAAQRSHAIRSRIASNLNEAQQRLQIPDEAQDDFVAFFQERGYTLEDFVDPELTFRVMADFSNMRATPEMERLRALHARREAFTPSIGSSGSAQGAAVPAAPADPVFERLLSKHLG